MKSAFLDAFSGLSGDMIAGAMLDAGADFDHLRRALASLPLDGYRVGTRRKVLSGISALKFEVEVAARQPERHLREIREIIARASALSSDAKERALAIFGALAEAEARVHRTSPEEVHFHEVGAVDSIVDIVAAAWGFEQLGVDEVLVSPLPAGSGIVRSQHGAIPVPAPATVELLAGFTLRIGDGAAEMVTPTGAAILRALARPAPPAMGFQVERVGYGAGSREFADRPNVLRLMLGERSRAWESDELLQIETNIDDLNPQVYEHVLERLFEAGARDVALIPMIMKKGRPGVTVAVLAEPAAREAIAAVLFAETSTIGLRYHPVARLKLAREFIDIETQWGPVRVKLSRAHGEVLTFSPEYEDCRRLAREHRVALRTVIEQAREAARRRISAHD
ncbi:MAG TPA: nickel pincer cofactor biosynthesis protein LarC [Candidatus Binataceae bacterium]|nr:nickel pincer cofactor biosynthesis protein LarC [Candidatus Binataceae bacterium]